MPARSPVPEGLEGEDDVPPLRFGGRQPSSDDTGNEGMDGGSQHAQVEVVWLRVSRALCVPGNCFLVLCA
jgi:hypothetical protein